MAFDGTLKFDTSIDQSGFSSGIEGLGGIAQKGMSLIADAVKAGTEAVANLGKKAIAVGSSFESSMAQVIATMGVTKDTVVDGVNSYDLLKDAAAKAGESTTFSASEAASALNFLALAGYDAAQAADALPAVLNLAAAGGMDLAYASDLATDAMAALGIKANEENLTHFGDQLAKTASKANASVSQLGEAILTVGGTAKNLAGDTTELNASLGVLANRGIKGAEGGTHLRNMILTLSAPTNTAAEALNRLGVSAKDSSGQLRPMNDIFKDLARSGAGIEDLNEIFNKTDLAAVQAMMAGCGEEFDNLAAEIGSCDGAMEQMAATMNDTLEGDMKSLGSKAEALGIAVYDGINAPLRELAQLGGQYLTQLTNGFKQGGFTGLASALGDVLGSALSKITEYLPGVLDIAQNVIVTLLAGIRNNLPTLMETGAALLKSLMSGIAQTGAQLLTLGAELLTALADGLQQNLPALLQTGRLALEQLGNALIRNLPLMIAAAVQIIVSLADALLKPDSILKLISAGITLLKTITEAILENLPLLIHTAVELITALCNDLLKPDNILRLIDAAIEILAALIDGIIDNLDEILIACEQIITTLWHELTKPETVQRLLELGGKLLAKLIEGLGQIGGKLAGFAWDLFEEAKMMLQNIDWASLGVSIVEGICSGLFDIDFKLDEFLGDFGDNWLTGIKSVFGIASPSKVMRDQVGRYLAEGVGQGFVDYMPDIEPEVRSMLRPQSVTPQVQSPAGSIVGSHTYAAQSAPEASERPLFNISAVFEMDGERFAAYTAERVDLMQGEAVTFDERGTAH